MNELHSAATRGSAEHTLAALLSSGLIDINQGTVTGWTPLMCGAVKGHPHVVEILLNNGADKSIAADGGATTLHLPVKTDTCP